eukprot:289264_1
MAQEQDAFDDAELTMLSIEILKDLSMKAEVDPEDSFVMRFERDNILNMARTPLSPDNITPLPSLPDDHDDHELSTPSINSPSTISQLSANTKRNVSAHYSSFSFNEFQDNNSSNGLDFAIISPSFHLPSFHKSNPNPHKALKANRTRNQSYHNQSHIKSKLKPTAHKSRRYRSATVAINRNSLSSIHRVSAIPDFEPRARKHRKHRHKHRKHKNDDTKYPSKGIVLPMSIPKSVSKSYDDSDVMHSPVDVDIKHRSRPRSRTVGQTQMDPYHDANRVISKPSRARSGTDAHVRRRTHNHKDKNRTRHRSQSPQRVHHMKKKTKRRKHPPPRQFNVNSHPLTR